MAEEIRAREVILKKIERLQTENQELKKFHEEFMAFLDENPNEKEDYERFMDYWRCKICLDAIMFVELKPCGHKQFCRRCVRKIKICPLCRAPIEDWNEYETERGQAYAEYKEFMSKL